MLNNISYLFIKFGGTDIIIWTCAFFIVRENVVNYKYNYLKEKRYFINCIINCADQDVDEILNNLNIFAEQQQAAKIGNSIVSRDDFELIRRAIESRFGIKVYFEYFSVSTKYLFYFDCLYDLEIAQSFLNQINVLSGVPEKSFIKKEDCRKFIVLDDASRKIAIKQAEKYWAIDLMPRFI